MFDALQCGNRSLLNQLLKRVVDPIVKRRVSSSHLHLQDLLQSLHDDQRGLLHRWVTVLRTVLHDLHQGLVRRAPQVILMPVWPKSK